MIWYTGGQGNMPLYDYRCHKCGETFEVMQKFSDAPLTVHEGCGGELQKLLSPPALQFKGSGWYITDYAKNGKSPSTNGKSSETKSETKSESTTKSETTKSSSDK
jgi:putative FmdB family regulatory protein